MVFQNIDVKIEELHWRSTKLIKNQHSHQKIIIYIFLVLRDTESRSGLFLHWMPEFYCELEVECIYCLQ